MVEKRSFRSDTRGLTPVVGKSLAVGLTLLYVTGMVGVLLGGVVPAYEKTAGAKIGDRVLSTAAGEIEQTASQSEGDLVVRASVELPPTINSAGYRLVLSGRTLRLDHPDEEIGGRVRLSLQPGLTVRSGAWDGGEELLIEMSGSADSRVLTIGETA